MDWSWLKTHQEKYKNKMEINSFILKKLDQNTITKWMTKRTNKNNWLILSRIIELEDGAILE